MSEEQVQSQEQNESVPEMTKGDLVEPRLNRRARRRFAKQLGYFKQMKAATKGGFIPWFEYIKRSGAAGKQIENAMDEEVYNAAKIHDNERYEKMAKTLLDKGLSVEAAGEMISAIQEKHENRIARIKAKRAAKKNR